MLKRAIIAVAIATAVAAPVAFAEGDVSKVNASIHIGDGEKAGDLDTVNGGITIGDEASAGTVETVNGSVKVGAGARIQSAETVNGGINLDERAIVLAGVEAVNGGIVLEKGAAVAGDVANVNGEIRLVDADVGGSIETVAGDVTIGSGSHVTGGLKIEKPTGGWFNWGNNSNQRVPRVVIEADAVIEGPLVFEREVKLFVHQSAKTGAITGAEAKRYSGATPD